MKKKKVTKKKPTKKTKSKKRNKRFIDEIKPEQILLRDRTVLLFNSINEKSSKEVVSQISALDILGNERIVLKINSGGGSILDGYAILDAMRYARSPIVTWITGYAASMAGVISIQGNLRLMSENSIWMAHPIHSGMINYLPMMKDRRVFHDLLEKQCEEIYRKYTKLSPKEVLKAMRGELWLNSKEALAKGIVDKIV